MSRRKFFKSVFRITVLTEDAPVGDDVEIGDVLYQISEGDWLGRVEVTSTDEIPPEKIVDECVALGNDGEFFSRDDDD